MSTRAHGQVRRSQVITTWGPGALIDLPRHSAIVGGLETWPNIGDLDEIVDQRVTQKLGLLMGVSDPRLYAPPADSSAPGEPKRGIGVWRFPQYFLVQEKAQQDARSRSRRVVPQRVLEKGRYDGCDVVPTRFVRACPRGHISDFDWRGFVHSRGEGCTGQLWLDETGTGGDLADLVIRCECGNSRGLYEAAESGTLGVCRGDRPWLGSNAREECDQPARLLIRTAANAYFPQVLSVLSLPDNRTTLQQTVGELWDDLSIVESAGELAFVKKKPKIAAKLGGLSDSDVLEAIEQVKHGGAERPVKQVELDALLAVPEGYGDDIPVDPNFHARRLPEKVWKNTPLTDGIESVTQLHRLREVLALTGFTRFEAVTPDVNGEFETDVVSASLAEEPTWFPAVENRGEGLFVLLDPSAVSAWLVRQAVVDRLDALRAGHQEWITQRNSSRAFPGGPYVLLHTLSHLLVQSMAMRCGYPASSIRERVYVDPDGGRYGLLLYTASPDAEGTLGGLVQQAVDIEGHLAAALRSGGLCSNDPVCAQHDPVGGQLEGRLLHGAACHGCALIAETSCEMRNDYLDRALVVPTLAVPGAAFFDPVT